jgi:hypothetical protein
MDIKANEILKITKTTFGKYVYTNMENTHFHSCSTLTKVWQFLQTCNTVQVMAFWVVMLCSVVVGYPRSGGPCCLHLQGDVEAARSSEKWVFYHITMWGQNLDLNLCHHENLKSHTHSTRLAMLML